MSELRSGAPVFRTDSNGRIREWNGACERLTGISASEAVSRPCWEVIAGKDANGGIVCHPGCSIARLAQEGWPVRCTDLQMRTRFGPKRFTISTIVVQDERQRMILHPLREATGDSAQLTTTADRSPHLTRRQREVLYLLMEGLRAKQIAGRLSLSETTVRNHIHAILRELGVQSQLEAVARARTLSLALEEPAT